MTKKLIDTNILIYAYDNSDLKKHNISKQIIKEATEKNEAILSIQNLVEFSRVLSEKAKIPVPYNEVRRIITNLELLFEIIQYNTKTIAEALDISSHYKLHFFDALITATMEENFISEIITENEKDFEKISNIKVINPFKFSH
ncbi:PIN domain-containing protein [Candidatus Woesearchaeota archaeon]|nr:PIN domain-containing protein [Candidatus Woesearchaeota archaeon]